MPRNEIEQIWGRVWQSENHTKASTVFRHVLFLAGYKKVRKYLHDIEGTVLEAGGGSGRYGIQIAADNPKCRVIVVDIAEESILLGDKLAEELGVNNVTFKRGDIFSLEYPGNNFDVVLSDAVIQVFEEYRPAINEMARVLKPGGLLLISVCNYWNFHTAYKWVLHLVGNEYKYGYEKSFKHRELVDAIASCGFEVLTCDGFAVGYGLARHNLRPLRIAGRIIDWVVWAMDKVTNGNISKLFGFEILVLARKNHG